VWINKLETFTSKHEKTDDLYIATIQNLESIFNNETMSSFEKNISFMKEIATLYELYANDKAALSKLKNIVDTYYKQKTVDQLREEIKALEDLFIPCLQELTFDDNLFTLITSGLTSLSNTTKTTKASATTRKELLIQIGESLNDVLHELFNDYFKDYTEEITLLIRTPYNIFPMTKNVRHTIKKRGRSLLPFKYMGNLGVVPRKNFCDGSNFFISSENSNEEDTHSLVQHSLHGVKESVENECQTINERRIDGLKSIALTTVRSEGGISASSR
jgi:hypothetical protein